MPRIRLWLDYPFANTQPVEEFEEVDDTEWAAMTPAQRNGFCQEAMSDFIANNLDSGWEVEGEES